MTRNQLAAAVPWWRQLRSRLVLYFVLLTVTPLAIVATIFGIQSEQQIRQQVFNQLETVSLLKESLVRSWLNEGSIGLKSLLTYTGERAALTSLLTDTGDDATTQSRVEDILLTAVETHPSLSEIFV